MGDAIELPGQPVRAMRAYIYARYSTDHQNEASIDAQVRACREYAQSKGIAVIKVYADEAVSGKGSKTAKRRQYQSMLRDCEHGGCDVILIHQYDRVARNVGEHANLEMKLSQWGVALVAVGQDFGTGKEAKLLRTIMWGLSEYYIDNLSAEVQKGHKESALKALHNGGYPPFGYDVVDRHYEINELEAGFVRKMFECAGRRVGFVELIDEMARCGIKGKRGKPILYTQIYEILRNEKYIGTYAYSVVQEKKRADRREKPNAIRIENAIPAIVDRALFEEVQIIMTERKQSGRRAGYLCSGLVYCSCGAKMHGATTHRKGHEYQRYNCSKKCGAGSVHMQDVDEAAISYLHDLLSDKTQEAITLSLLRYMSWEKQQSKEFNSDIQKKIGEKQQQYEGYLDKLGSNLPSDVIADIGKRMQAIKEEISALGTVEAPRSFTVEQIRDWLETIKNAPDEKAVHLLIERIDVDKNSRTIFNITSTLNTVLGTLGCGGQI